MTWFRKKECGSESGLVTEWRVKRTQVGRDYPAKPLRPEARCWYGWMGKAREGSRKVCPMALPKAGGGRDPRPKAVPLHSRKDLLL